MLIAAIVAAVTAALIVTGGGGGPDVTGVIAQFWRKKIRDKKLVPEAERRQELEVALDAIVSEMDLFQSNLYEAIAQLDETHRNYDATLEDYLLAVEGTANMTRKHQYQLLERGDEFIELVGEDLYASAYVEIQADLAKRDAKAAKAADKAAKKQARNKP